MYRVVWLRAIQQTLTRLWTNADAKLRQAITTASHQIDQRLQTDPWKQGESRSSDRRVLIEGPLTVHYEVHDEEMTVVVLSVRVFKKRKR